MNGHKLTHVEQHVCKIFPDWESLGKVLNQFPEMLRPIFTRRYKTLLPCLDLTAEREKKLLSPSRQAMEGPEPSYDNIVSGYELYRYKNPFHLQHGGQLKHGFQIAYETWGHLNADKSNAILLHTGLSVNKSVHWRIIW
jgi:hypothetical protein